MIENKLIKEVIKMSFLNKDFQKVNNQLDIKINMTDSAFQKIFDKISNGDLYKKEFFLSSFQHNIYHIQRVMFF